MIARAFLSLLFLVCFTARSLAAPDSVVSFNEIQYNPYGPSENGEFVELFNEMGIKVDVSGWRIDGIGYTFPAGTIINPGAYVVVAKTPTAGQFGPFPGNLDNGGQHLRLINQSDRLMDEIEFTDDDPWPAGADGSGYTLAKLLPYTDSNRHANWTVSAQAGGTPGAVNFPAAGSPPPVTTVPLIALNKTWRYNQSGPAFDSTWAATAHPVGGTWFSGAGALAYETPPSATVPIGTTLTFPNDNHPYVFTYYFETEFTLTPAQLASLSALKIRYAIDDGAVFYLNGQFAWRYNMPGDPISSSTPASSNVEAGTSLTPNIPLPTTALVTGSNRLSVEVHQSAAGNSDIVFATELDAEISLTSASAPPLRINEIPAATVGSWWLEIVNTSGAPVDLAGVVLGIGGDATREYTIPAGTLGGGEFLLLPEATLGFRPADGEKVFLYGAGKASLLDARQQTGRLRGRAPARGGEWAYPANTTPGSANTFDFHSDVVISEIQYNPPALVPIPATPPTFQTTPLIGYNDVWRYNAADENLPADWAATTHPLGGNWKSGAGPIGVESATLAVPLVTVISPYSSATFTYYFEREFTLTAQQLATATSLEITHEIDDGAVFYLNGAPLSKRFNMPDTGVGPETLANPSVPDAVIGSLVLSTTGLQVGTNRLSVEVHQSGAGSSDIVFGMKLDARVQTSSGTPAQPLRNSNNQWLELTNRGTSDANLTGWDFGDGITFAFPVGTMLAPGERACIVRDPALFQAAYPAARVLGVFTGSLSRNSEHLVLRDALRNTADEVRYADGGAWPQFADGGGSSLELRDLFADHMNGASWAASDESSRTAWKTYTFRGTAAASNGGPDGTWQEFNMGMLAAGEIWIDDLSVIESPSGAAVQRITDPGFNNATAWRRIGNHRASEIISEPGNPGNKILRLVANGPTEHMHNQIEHTLNAAVTNGREYEISFRARWVTGSNQLHTRLYFNRLAHVNVIDRVTNPGTPGAVNSRAVANAGPTFTNLKHSPPVPTANATTTVSCTASDPDGISGLTLFYSVNGGAFASTAMAASAGGNYSGAVPGQAAGAVVQFYLRATDNLGAITFYPPAGPNSRALYKVNDGTASSTGIHNFRLITTNADRDWMHLSYNVMSNDLIGCTVIDRENDIYYNAGVHLKSSERGRNQLTRVGYAINFPVDGLFRGIHDSVTIDRSEGQAPGQRELLFDVMISNAKGPISRYNDLIKLLAPNSALTGSGLLQMARYEDLFLDAQFNDNADGSLFEYELVYYPTTADANGGKLTYPSPDGVIGLSFQDYGDDPERYRWHFLKKNHREADDFTPLMNYAKLFSKSGADFEAGVPNLIDLDAWFRGLGYAVMSGATDNAAGDGSQHNAWLYARPDGRVIFLPHDMDNGFDSGLTIFRNQQCATLTSNASRKRLYLGHLHDMCTTTFNSAYISTWTTHFATLDPAQDWANEMNYVGARNTSVISQITAQIPQVNFALTTAGPLTVGGSTATISGKGWVNVRGIRLVGSTEFLPITWSDTTTWQITVPVAPGQSTVNLQAVNFSGTVIGTASLTVNNTSTVAPASASNLVVSEIMYHPSNLTPSEITAGFTDAEQFEYIEIMNISGTNTVDLAGTRFTSGIDYTFAAGTTLAPGGRLIVVHDRSAFLARHPGAAGKMAAGAFLNDTGLSNSSEEIALTSAGGSIIKAFTYADAFPWPAAADGDGASLVLIAPLSNPDHTLPANWRASVASGGKAGVSDSVPFTGNPTDDLDNDGLTAFVEHALGTSDSVSNFGDPASSAGVSFSVSPGGFLTLTATRDLAADDVIIEPQLSTDLAVWDSNGFTLVSEVALGSGLTRLTWQSTTPVPTHAFGRFKIRSR